MRELQIRFEADPALDGIELLIRAPEDDAQVAEIRKRLAGLGRKSLTVFDRFDNPKLIPAEEIVSASVNGKLVEVVTASGSYTTRQTLKNLEAALDGRSFVRISRYEIVNLAKVESFDFTLAGTLRLELTGGMETWASRRCISQIRKRLMGKE